MSIFNAFKNVNGEPEIGRILLALAVLFAIVSPIVFQSWAMWNGAEFDVTAWCLAFPGGIMALHSGGVFAIGKKDANVEAARKAK
ncbi:MAG TPA: hypothetical protein VF389_11650 [Woeseiaceae bacterium]